MNDTWREKYVDAHDGGRVGWAEAVLFNAGRTKTASVKTAELEPGLRDYIDRLRPVDGKLYILVNALGAGEYWSANRNGDWFSEQVLRNEDPTNGYKTFYNAGVFRDHAMNKQPEHSFGRVCVAVYNPRMHRVELLLEIDRAKAIQEGHQDLLARLDAGENCPTSMGMRTPYDQCSECGHQSKVDADRCECIRQRKNVILPDGRLVCMVNPVFKAFDISLVTIGADLTSYTIMKIASALSSARPGPYRPMPPPMRRKTAGNKLAELIKRVPGMAAAQDREAPLPPAILSALAQGGLPSALATPTALGIVLKPQEFQRIVLISVGRQAEADGLDRCGCTFSPGPSSGTEVVRLDMKDVSPTLASALRPHMPARSAVPQALQRRISGGAVKVASGRYTQAPRGECHTLDALASLYSSYRDAVVAQAPLFFDKVASQDPEVLHTMIPDELDLALRGLIKLGSIQRPSVTGNLPLAYLLTHVYRLEGESGVTGYVQRNPSITAGYLGLTDGLV